jgi:sulfite reductase (NADPH) flavoprotein alpha-component
MTISIWRLSHLTLAISASLFIVIAAITGLILTFEPISNKLKPYSITNNELISIAQTIDALEKKYNETITIEVDENNFVAASIIDKNGAYKSFYINPKTGEKIGDLLKKSHFYDFITNLHRSLFLKSTGRLLIGFVSFLLFLITITGTLLIVKRQGGIRNVFSKIVKENFQQYYHIFFGKIFFIPIVIITLTGVYLSLERFSLLPGTTNNTAKLKSNKSNKTIKFTDFEFFKTTNLEKVKKIEFPFSSSKEDYFNVKTIDNEFEINQFNGQIIGHKKQSLSLLGSHYSLLLHTGAGSILWSIILLLSCLAILFFIFSGFYMTVKRRRNTTSINNNTLKDEAEFIILVGSETGTTIRFATAFKNALIQANKAVFIAELNMYSSYKNAKNIIIFTATYGDGDAPANAQNFIKLINLIEPKRNLNYSVIGFGSKQYPAFCEFAILVHASLQIHEKFKPEMPLFKIDDQHLSSFENWKNEWGNLNNINLEINLNNLLEKDKETIFKITNKSKINIDNTFLISLKPTSKLKFTSGDLLAITPKGKQTKRLYSIAKIDNTLLLSVKKHDLGICSNYLDALNKNAVIEGVIQQNKKFHFPKKTKDIILIANGTGIAPFLGMIQQNKKTRIHLFWGGRTKKSLELYNKQVTSALENKTLTSFHVAYSQDQQTYIQKVLESQTVLVSNTLRRDGVVLICGSLSMQFGVEKVITKIASQELNLTIEELRKKKQIRTDCY